VHHLYTTEALAIPHNITDYLGVNCSLLMGSQNRESITYKQCEKTSTRSNISDNTSMRSMITKTMHLEKKIRKTDSLERLVKTSLGTVSRPVWTGLDRSSPDIHLLKKNLDWSWSQLTPN